MLWNSIQKSNSFRRLSQDREILHSANTLAKSTQWNFHFGPLVVSGLKPIYDESQIKTRLGPLKSFRLRVVRVNCQWGSDTHTHTPTPTHTLTYTPIQIHVHKRMSNTQRFVSTISPRFSSNIQVLMCACVSECSSMCVRLSKHVLVVVPNVYVSCECVCVCVWVFVVAKFSTKSA